jgi:hypothetical protein
MANDDAPLGRPVLLVFIGLGQRSAASYGRIN